MFIPASTFHHLFLARLFLFAVTCAPLLSSGQVAEGRVVVPNVSATKPGIASTDVPFLGNNTFLKQVYDASQFSSLRDGALLTGVSFRAQEGLRTEFEASYSKFEIQLATYPAPIESIQAGYFPEQYPDATVVYNQQNVHLHGLSSTSPDVPAPFQIHIQFDKPFLYDPHSGNLLMYLESGAFLGGRDVRVDTYDSAPAFGSFAYGNVDGQNFSPTLSAVVAQFDYTVIPEPLPWALMSLCLFGFIILQKGIIYRGDSC